MNAFWTSVKLTVDKPLVREKIRWRLTEVRAEASVQTVSICRVPTVRRRKAYQKSEGECLESGPMPKNRSKSVALAPKFSVKHHSSTLLPASLHNVLRAQV